jgi:hypothetical protein
MDRPLVAPKPTKLPTNAWTSERPTELAGAYRFACTVNAIKPQTGRGQYRCAAGRLSRKDHRPATVDYIHKKQTGGSGQFRPRQDLRRARFRRERRRVREHGARRLCAEGIHPRR